MIRNALMAISTDFGGVCSARAETERALLKRDRLARAMRHGFVETIGGMRQRTSTVSNKPATTSRSCRKVCQAPDYDLSFPHRD